jgi:TonB family protein
MPAAAARTAEPFDELTLRRAQRGDEAAWRALIERHQVAVHAVIKLCVDATGKVARVILLKSSGYPAYDEKIVTETKGWKYKPYVVDGKPVPVCTALTFIYSLE